jgi:TRAP-type mannitol/chloroaromatic compound transport system permease small subunit
MKLMKRIRDIISLLSEGSASLVKWICVLLIIIITFDVMMRYVFNSPTFWAFDISYMLLAVFASFGFGYVQYHRGHARIDIFSNMFSTKMKLWIDITFTIIFFLPLFTMLAIRFVDDAIYAIQIGEVTKITFWFALTWPYKTLVAIAFCLLLLQGINAFIQDVNSLVRGSK